MKTYYIPTSTLNFNNILSSESISPKAFYDKRGFGYSRWTSVAENNIDNAVLLYDSLCYFERPKSDIEDHPLLVAVKLDEREIKTLSTNNVFYSDKTIYLNPYTTRFIFFSNNDLRVTLSMSNSSLDTKMVNLYKDCFAVESNLNKKYSPIKITEYIELNENGIENDFKINKMKGMLYGYYIGGLLSTTKERVVTLKNLYEIHNTFAAIVSSFDRKPTQFQKKELDKLFWNCFISTTDNDSVSIDEYYTKNKKERQSILELFQDINRICDKKEDLIYSLSIKQEEENNKAITWIEEKISKQKKEILDNHKPINSTDSEICITNDNLELIVSDSIIKDTTTKNIFIKWISDILLSKKFSGNISSKQKELADEITVKAKEIIGNEWDNCSIRKYLNSLRKYIAGNTDFEMEWDNGVISSMSAVIISGDEWSKLLKYMQNKEMYDYRIAFALYGTLNGFADLGRDFTDILLGYKNIKYVENVYRKFYGQLFGKDFPTKSIPITDNEQNQQLTNISKENYLDNVNTLGTNDSNENFSNELKHFIEDTIPNYIDKEKALRWYIKETKNLWKGKLDKNFIESLSLLGELSKETTITKGTKGKWDKCIKHFSNELNITTPKNKTATKKQDERQVSLFDENDTYLKTGDFYCDTNVGIFIIEELLKNNTEKEKNQVLKDTKWFQDNYNESYIDEKGTQQDGKYKNIPKDNYNTVIHYERYLYLKRDNSPNYWLKKIYNEIDIDSIIKELKLRYNVS